jgi:hypothetical protein
VSAGIVDPPKPLFGKLGKLNTHRDHRGAVGFLGWIGLLQFTVVAGYETNGVTRRVVRPSASYVIVIWCERRVRCTTTFPPGRTCTARPHPASAQTRVGLWTRPSGELKDPTDP